MTIRTSFNRLLMAVATAALLMAGPAHAFFPFGGYDTFGTLRIGKWPLAEFDTNNDGEVSPGEGREVFIEGGKAGFTTDEIEVIRRALKTWSDVPTSYAAFRVGGITQDPVLLGSVVPDGISTIVMEVTEADVTGEDVVPDVDGSLTGVLDAGILGVTITTYAQEDGFVEVAGQIFNVSAGQILDADIVISAALTRRFDTTSGVANLEGVMLHELGHFLGLGHPPLNNLRLETGGVVENLVENAVFPLTGADGIQRVVGVTPTMYPIIFQVLDNQGRRTDGNKDLAPDDISGISWLYPRGSQASFFNVNHEARTQTRPGSGIPSQPVVGGHVVAWADEDGDPDSPRVPVFSTITGLFQRSTSPQLGGQFEMVNLWKQFETLGSPLTKRIPSYTFTISPLNGGTNDLAAGFPRQSPPGITPFTTDSIQGGGGFSVSNYTRSEDDYLTSFFSEVFQEVENLIDVSNKDAGTPMLWSFEQNTLVSQSSGRTLASIRPGNRPLFGDPNDVCPFNITEVPGGGTGGTGTTPTGAIVLGSLGGNDKLRHFRDTYLLQSSLGTAMVNGYYRVAPSLGGILLESPAAFRAFQGFKSALNWTMEHSQLMLLALLSCTLLPVALWRFRRVRAGRAALALLLAPALLVAGNAEGLLAYMSFNRFVTEASEIHEGNITNTRAYWGKGGRIFTDVTISIDGTAKGADAKATQKTFTVIGGRIGSVVTFVSEMPTFKTGEDVVVYLRRTDNNRLFIFGGTRGKVPVYGDGSGAKYIATDAMATDAINKTKAKRGDKSANTAPEGFLNLDDYMEAVRDAAENPEE